MLYVIPIYNDVEIVLSICLNFVIETKLYCCCSRECSSVVYLSLIHNTNLQSTFISPAKELGRRG